MRKRLPLVLSSAAFVLSLLGMTPIGEAARQAVPPFATRAKVADYAKNAGAVNGLKASKRPRVGWLVALGKDAKFPKVVGQVGPTGAAGPKGDKGDKGDKGETGETGATGVQGSAGISGYEVVTSETGNNSGQFKNTIAGCPGTKKVIGGGGYLSAVGTDGPAVYASYPDSDGWNVAGVEIGAYMGNWKVIAFAICANVSS